MTQITPARIEARQRANRCNQDNEACDWGRPCCDKCICADEAAGHESHADQCKKEDQEAADRISIEGMLAYVCGDPITANPYLKGSEEWAAWREGYDR